MLSIPPPGWVLGAQFQLLRDDQAELPWLPTHLAPASTWGHCAGLSKGFVLDRGLGRIHPSVYR